MSKTITSVTSVVVTFLVTLVLNTVTNYYASDKGSVSISRPTKLDGTPVVIVTIENFSTEPLSGLVLEVPTTISSATIIVEPAVVVEELPSSAKLQTKLLKLSQIRPQHVSRLIVPTLDANQSNAIRVTNLRSTGLSLRADDKLDSPIRTALFSGLITALFAGFVYALFAFFLYKEHEALSSKIDELRRENAESHRDLTKKDAEWQTRAEKLENRMEALQAVLVKQRLLLQARLRDYATELSFWRNTVATLVNKFGAQNLSGEKLFEHVTQSLGTFGTLSHSEREFKTIELASQWMADIERKAQSSPSPK